jgi:Ca2+-binding RTX toxin-like protein
MANEIRMYYEFALQQIAGESYFDGVVDFAGQQALVTDRLRSGNNRDGFEKKGFSRLTDAQVAEFLATFQLVAQASDYADSQRIGPVYYPGTTILANSGMSATLIHRKGTNEFTLAIRSTEFRTVPDGGDRGRDGFGADVQGIFANGFALAQLNALEEYYAWLKQSGTLPIGATLNVTGYSLGGHLATVFTEIHANDPDVDLSRTFTFNGAGRGTWTGTAADPRAIVSYYKAVLADPNIAAAFVEGLPQNDIRQIEFSAARLAALAGQPLDPISIYADPRHEWAQRAASIQFGLMGAGVADQGIADLRNGAAAKITQLYGKEFPIEATGVANSGVHGPATGVFVEAQPFVEGAALLGGTGDWGNAHALVLIVDSLAVMRVYQTLDQTISLDTLNRLFSYASNKRPESSIAPAKVEDDPLELMLDALRRLFLGSEVTRTEYKPGGSGFGNLDFRNGLYNNIDELTTNASFTTWALNQVKIVDLTTMSAEDMIAVARGDIAYRYALRELNPFAITEAQALYDGQNADGRLTLFAPGGNTPGGMTDEYLIDRAAFMTWRNLANGTNESRLRGPAGPENWRFADLTREYAIDVVGQVLGFDSLEPARIASFGSERADPLVGGFKADRLYGMGGADYIEGKFGNDYLEGGTGPDVYTYNISHDINGLLPLSDGDDEIRDTDGKGVLRIVHTDRLIGFAVNSQSTIVADASIKVSGTEWRSADGKFGYVKQGADLVITINGDATGSLRLKDFRDGDFGIRPREAVTVPQNPIRTFFGDTQDWDSDPVQAGIQPEMDGFGNFKRADGQDGRPSIAALNRPDLFYGAPVDEVERFTTGDGNDVVYADGPPQTPSPDGGTDLIEAGEGRDIVWSGPGNDFIEGGADGQEGGFPAGDVVNAGSGDDTLYANARIDLAAAILQAETMQTLNAKGDFLSAGDGDDRLVGGAENDALLGGAGDDVLVGSAGDDSLWGDLAHGADSLAWSVTRLVIEPSAEQGAQRTFDVLFSNVLVAPIPQGGADAIYGGAGADWSFGGGGDDFIDAGSGNDVSFGQGGADILVGGSGDDTLSGDDPGTAFGTEEGGDYLDGGAGDDELFGNGGEDVLVGGPGKDTLVGGAGKDIYVFTKGDGVGGDVVIDTPVNANDPEKSELVLGDGLKRTDVKFFVGSLGIDLGPSDPGNPGSPHDSIRFEGFNPFDPYATPVLGAIRFTDGTSMTYGDILTQGFDIDGTEGADNEHLGGATLRGTAVVDRIRGFGGDDLLVGLAGDDVLDAGGGADELQGGDGNDNLLAGAGSDHLFGETGDDTLSGGDGNDALVGGTGNDLLAGDVGSDSIWGGAGDDVLDGGSDNDILHGNEGPDTLDGGAGDDTLYAHTFVFVSGVPMLNPLDDDAADMLLGGDGDDYLNSGGGADSLAGGAGADVLEAEGGDDVLDGGDGADDLIGGDGSDVLIGGPGDDVLRGGAGNDFHVFNLGDAHDTIYDGALDIVTFGTGIGTADLSLWQSGADLVIGHVNGADTLTVANWYLGTQYEISQFEFTDGSIWSATYANDQAERTKFGTAGPDSIFGIAIDETISGFAGNDQLFGNGGADTLLGGAGDDTLNGGNGSDTYRFYVGDGRDVIEESGSGNDALVFGPGIAKGDIQCSRSGNDLLLVHANGTDRVTIKDWFNDVTKQIESITFAGTGESLMPSELTDPFLSLMGTAGNDFMSGGDAYGETILGLPGNDELHGGAGNDSLTGGPGSDGLFGENGNDRYYFAAGDGQDVITDPTGLNVIQFGPNLVSKLSVGPSGFDQLISFTGTTDSVLVKAGGFFPTLAFELVGSNSADNLTGSSYKDIVSALAGNDSVRGGGGIDEIHGGAGNDTLEGGLEIDDLWGDEGDDVLDGDLLNDPFATEGGYVTRFRGGSGNDTLYGSTAADSYYFDLGEGQDTIIDEPIFSNGLWRYSLSDDLIFGAGITPSSIAAHASGGDLIVDVSATDRVTLKNWLSDPKYRVDILRFTDGSSLNEAQIADLVNVRQGTAGNDALTGTDACDERMYGRAGDDTLAGLGGNDLLEGGTGNDVLDGGAGNDTYVINVGDGTDLIRESGGADAIRFGPGVSAGDVLLQRAANNLVLRLPGGSDMVSVENYLKDPNAWVEAFIFTDGSSLSDANTIVEQLTAIRGTASADNLVGTGYADRIYGMDGDDTLSGGADDDTLNGDAGDDLLAGGAGTDLLAGGDGLDRYEFNSGDGSDTISDPDSGNLVQFGTGITQQSVVTTRTNDDLVLSVSGTADRLSIPGYFVGYPVAEFRFAAGTVWTVDTIKSKVTTPTSGADTLVGFESNDSLSGLAGADTIYGRGGNDTLDGGLGSDTLYGEDGNDTLIGGAGEAKNASVSNSLYGGTGDDVLIGGGNANSGERLDGGLGADLLLGGIGQEIIDDTGYDGRNSLMFGSAAVDTMRMYGGAAALAIGGAGNDRVSGGLGVGIAKTRMIVAFNKADGIDTVDQLAPGSTITIGGGTLYSNLSLEVSGTGLRLKTSSSNYVYLSDWYSTASGAGGKAVSTLQIVIEGTKDYKPTSGNPMNNAKIVAFDFLGLVAAFDAARAAGQTFNLASSLPAHRLWSSNNDAIGGAIAYEYAKSGSLGALTHDQLRAVVNGSGFAAAPQSIAPAASAMSQTADIAIVEPVREPLASADAETYLTDKPQAAEIAAPLATTVESSVSGFDSRPADKPDPDRSVSRRAEPELSSRHGATYVRPAARLAASSVSGGDVPINTGAWRRIARDLPVHLDECLASGMNVAVAFWNPDLGMQRTYALLSVVAAVGIDMGPHRLRQFEGLKEGLAPIA